MIFYYLDASAWVKRYYSELGTRWVQELFAQNPTIACASLGLIEVTATLARKRKAREIDPLPFEQKVQELEEDWGSFIQIALQRRFADVEDRLVFVASDRELKEAAQSSGLAVIDPEEEEKQATTPGDGAQEGDKP